MASFQAAIRGASSKICLWGDLFEVHQSLGNSYLRFSFHVQALHENGPVHLGSSKLRSWATGKRQM